MAAVIVKQPDSISMSGNLSPLIVQTSEALPVFLTVGGEILLSETYYPGDGNLVEVDFRDVVESCLAFSFPDQDIFTQSTLARTFTVLFGAAQTVTFTAVRSGKAHLNESASSFLKGNFLTWQPTTKYVTYYSPEWLTYFAVESCSIVLKAYFSGGETQLISLTSLSAGSCVTVNLQYAVVCGKLSNRRPMYYDVWAQGSSGARLTYIQRYMASAPQSPDESWYLFENSLGGLDSLRAYGSLDFAPEFEHQIAQTSDGLQEYRIDTSRVYTRYTGYLNPAEAKWLQDLFSARQKYAYTHSGYYRIVFTSSDGAYSGADMPSSYSFSYRFAEDDPFLDIQRDEDLPGNIEIALPDQEAFFLPPRLAEYPKLEGNEDTLLLSQQPHTEEWGTLTFGEIVNGILDKLVARLEGLKLYLSDIGGGGSGDIYLIKEFDTTTPSDTNAFSALRTLAEIAKAIDQALKDFTEEFDLRYLRKDIPDSTQHLIQFFAGLEAGLYAAGGKDGSKLHGDGLAELGRLQVNGDAEFRGNLSSKEFISGFTAGKGWAIQLKKYINAAGVEETKSYAELDNLTVRGILRVFEFVVSQMLGENDNRTFTGMMEVDHYDPSDGKVYLDTQNGKLYNPFRADDYIIVQQYNGMPSEENDYYVTKQYELIITEVGVGSLTDGEDRLDWVKFKNFTSQMETTPEEIISKGDTFVRIDNLSDPDRKGIIQMMTVGNETPYMDVIYGAKTDPDHALKSRFGNLQGIYNTLFGWLQSFGAYIINLYAVGEYRQRNTGEDLDTKIEMLKEQFMTQYNKVRYDLTDEDNYLSNATFTENMEGWTVENVDVQFLSSGDTPIYLNRSLIALKNSIVGIEERDGKNMLRISNGTIRQANSLIRKPGTHKVYIEGETDITGEYDEELDKLYLTLKILCVNSGDLEIGFPSSGQSDGSLPYTTMSIDSSPDYQILQWQGTWDGQGDFVLSFTGDLFVSLLALTSKPLDDYRIESETRFEQTATHIGLLATKTDNIEGSVLDLGVELDTVNESIRLYAQKITDNEQKITELEVTVDGITSTVEGSLNGETIISTINQTASSVSIDAKFINLNGAITANGTFKIDTNGYMTAIGGTIGGFTISSNKLVSGSLVLTRNLISFTGYSGKTEAQLGSNTSSAGGWPVPLFLRNATESGGAYPNGSVIELEIGRSAYSNVPQKWIDCKHAQNMGYGSKFQVESRYLGDSSNMERTVINVGQLMRKSQATKVNSDATAYYNVILAYDSANGDAYLVIED